jgi:DNA-binding MurR/RpiR family transcriptional regulator
MATLIIENDRLLTRLQTVAEHEHSSVEGLIERLLDQYEALSGMTAADNDETSLMRMARLIKQANFRFEHSFDAAEAESVE